MNHERKESKEQFYLHETESGSIINIAEERDTAGESINDGRRHDKERTSELQERNLSEEDMAKQARRFAVNYARSLLLF
ncbi:hypothetical protein [Sphingobacterium haloxyli]|uniref:Uncharacterized protein n=1 Tax=Sphingobacterium haloxyli TaxID=2100533 RepID=A0A2S9J715_9SPHI|nr:hypothetical protein [Sphingobacterium haloxyli]PRD48562.1 hypothetical protein C5745_05010 [Sphingobacterium haloxyli]